jgi:type 1 glutamine amidotransferase
MKNLVASLLLVVLTCVAATAIRAEEPKIRVLLTYGGHGFDEKEFFAMFDAMKDIEYTKAELPKDVGLLKAAGEGKFDVVVMYDMCNNANPEQQKAFEEAFAAMSKKGVGIVSLHHNMGAHGKWDQFRKIIGGKFNLQDCEIDGKKYKTSGWDHDQDLNVTVADKNHPITQGIQDFKIHDETYIGYYVAPHAKVLLTTDHPKNNPQLAWVTSDGKSKVFYLMLGHDKQAYANPSYVKLVHQGICWAEGK